MGMPIAARFSSNGASMAMTRKVALVSSLVVCGFLTGFGSGNTDSPVTPTGADESTKTKVLEAGAKVLQSKPPIQAINAYLDGFHFYRGQMDA